MTTQSHTPTISPASPSAGQRLIARTGWALGALGVAAWGLRYLLQGTGTMWTDNARTFYIKDATLGWSQTTDSWFWLGLEGLGAVAGALAGALVMWWLANRGGKGAKLFRLLGVVAAAVLFAAPVVPALAFLSGMPPEGAVAVLPAAGEDVAVAAPGEGSKALSIPAGPWIPSTNPEHALVAAQLTAGGETFDARFGNLSGAVQMNAADPAASTFALTVDAASVATGIPLRDSHARDYLLAEKHPQIAMSSRKFNTFGATAESGLFAWTGEVEVALMGKTATVPASGTLRIINDAGRGQIGVTAAAAVVVEGRLELPLAATPIDPELFDTKTIPLSFRSVLVPK